MRAGPVILFLVLALAGCDKPTAPPPPRLTTPAAVPETISRFDVPVVLPLPSLEAALERGAPHRLWSIDQRQQDCVPAQQAELLGSAVKVTPDISCRIVGQVTRGPIRLAGAGTELVIRMPVRARVSARDVGGILKGETATAAAEVRARVRIGLDPDWRLRGRVAIDYDWKEPPGIDFLGRRIRFVERTDRALAGVIARLERDLQRELARVAVRPAIESAWREGFLVIALNRARPPAWMRISPEALGLTGMRVDGQELRLNVSGRVLTETFISDAAPAPRRPTPLPPPIKTASARGFSFAAPVLADYAQLEPVVLRALRKLNARGIVLGQFGRVEALFDRVTIYPSVDGRLVVGVRARVRRLDSRVPGLDFASRGTVWLIGLPVNAPNSRQVEVRDLAIAGRTDNLATNLLLSVLDAPETRASIADALVQNFERDYQKVLSAARKAIADRRLGPLRLRARIDDVRHGQVEVTGSGLLLIVSASGAATLAHAGGTAR